jgi:hypothetical protein
MALWLCLLVALAAASGCLTAGPPGVKVISSFSLDQITGIDHAPPWAFENGTPARRGMLVSTVVDRNQVPDRTIVNQSNGSLAIQSVASYVVRQSLDDRGETVLHLDPGRWRLVLTIEGAAPPAPPEQNCVRVYRTSAPTDALYVEGATVTVTFGAACSNFDVD